MGRPGHSRFHIRSLEGADHLIEASGHADRRHGRTTRGDGLLLADGKRLDRLMKVKVWGARGSVPSPGPETNRYGGNTSCVQVTLSDGTVIVLDAGTGIRSFGLSMPDL